jgi:hypothetical protein
MSDEIDRVRLSAALSIHPAAESKSYTDAFLNVVRMATEEQMREARKDAEVMVDLNERLRKGSGDNYGLAALELMAMRPVSGLALYMAHRLAHNIQNGITNDAVLEDFPKRQRVIASGPRKRAENIARNDLLEAMRREKTAGVTFKEFLKNLEDGFVEGLTAEMDESELYTIRSDNSDDPYQAKGSTLERKLWTETDSPLTG